MLGGGPCKVIVLLHMCGFINYIVFAFKSFPKDIENYQDLFNIKHNQLNFVFNTFFIYLDIFVRQFLVVRIQLS